MRSALYNSLKASMAPYLSKTFKLPYPYFQAGLSYSLKTAQKTIPYYKFRRIDVIHSIKEEKHQDIPVVIITEEIPMLIIAEDIPLEKIDEEPPEPFLTFTFKKDYPINIVVGAKMVDSAIGKRKKKNILTSSKRHLTWKNLTSVSDSIFIAASKLWEDHCGILFTQTHAENPSFTYIFASENEETHPDLKDAIAMAFFPHEETRTVKIFKKFNNQFNQVAAIAHELGHIMGFCHEHEDHYKNRHLTEDYFEEYISEYDPLSIMNYEKIWVDEKQKTETKLSVLDIKGAKEIYGESINGGRKELQKSRSN